ncbi:MAG: hypothetical protein WDO73_36810 [Ignavibacteriota bacterium]
MPPKKLTMLDVHSRPQWRTWLEEHHQNVSEVWLVFHRHPTPAMSLTYEDAVGRGVVFRLGG